MKELSIEQKAQRYNEALKRAKKLYEQGTITESLSYVFPELKESDDERIRKWLIFTLKSLNNSPVQIDGAYEMMLPAIDWLEKQGQQKPTDKVEPKFHEGEWINGYYTNYKVLSVNNDGYVVEDVDGNKINILFENEKFHHLFTIADAKDGDVLEYQGEIFIIRELKKKVIASRTIEYYCCYDGEHFINNSIYSLMDDD
jgi:hypothetical protein